mmetsp:Transcript_53930/g.89521  ORF Transcript_53930/g.89521 Transcript_53930/m.89521 type:complete len:191 (+) Transcript_53930:161-733(+)
MLDHRLALQATCLTRLGTANKSEMDALRAGESDLSFGCSAFERHVGASEPASAFALTKHDGCGRGCACRCVNDYANGCERGCVIDYVSLTRFCFGYFRSSCSFQTCRAPTWQPYQLVVRGASCSRKIFCNYYPPSLMSQCLETPPDKQTDQLRCKHSSLISVSSASVCSGVRVSIAAVPRRRAASRPLLH